MLVAIGRFYLLRHGGIVVIVAVIAVVLILRFWPRFISWIENRRR
jgi:hypothetical protein